MVKFQRFTMSFADRPAALLRSLSNSKSLRVRFASGTFLAAAALGVLLAVPAVAGEATHGMAVSAQRAASAAGLEILRTGGNAIDAAVAVGYALAVVDPCCGNVGGGGFMLIHRAAGGDTFVNFRETAPQAATPDMYLDAAGNPIRDASLYGYRAVAVPGTVKGLDLALSRYGRLKRDAVMAPAIALARDGFVLGAPDAAIIAHASSHLAADPEAARIFLQPDGTPYRTGARLVQPDLAATLDRIAKEGPDGFYRGPVAAALAAAMAAHGGLITEADLGAFTATELAPLGCDYRGYRIVSAAPPSSGGIGLCESLNILSGFDFDPAGLRSPRAVHLAVEAMRRAFFDRNTRLGDPDFAANAGVTHLLSPEAAALARTMIKPDKATPSVTDEGLENGREKPQTTHYSVVDGEGNAVAVTYTLNGGFGASVVVPGTGVLLNDEMDDFTVKRGIPNQFGLIQGNPNAIFPGKRPLSSMTPTIVERDGRPVYVLGSPGGPRIITAVLETVMNLIDFRMAPDAAVAAPRFHHQYLPDTVFYEQDGLPPATLTALEAMGYSLKEQAPWGAVELIAIAPGGALVGVNDPRRPAGAALGD
jgi:gamma-glutamyltranspeptidase / glutathione hydrolase